MRPELGPRDSAIVIKGDDGTHEEERPLCGSMSQVVFAGTMRTQIAFIQVKTNHSGGGSPTERPDLGMMAESC